MRNFEKYNNRHEAHLAYESLPHPPYWFENDDIPAYLVVDFEEWLWLPIRDDNQYTKDDERKYILGTYI